MKDASGSGYDGTTDAAFEQRDGRNALVFDGSNSASLPFDTISYPATVSFDLYIDEDCFDQAVLFESANGRLVLNAGNSGKLGCERCGCTFAFDYEMPKETWIQLTLTMDAINTTLYVNGWRASVGTNQKTAINNRKDSNTFMFPFETILSGAKGAIDSLSVYNRVLSEEEIANLCDFEVPVNLALGKLATASLAIRTETGHRTKQSMESIRIPTAAGAPNVQPEPRTNAMAMKEPKSSGSRSIWKKRPESAS